MIVPGSQNSKHFGLIVLALFVASQSDVSFGSAALFKELGSTGFKMDRIGEEHLSGVLGKSETKSSENKTFFPFLEMTCFVGVVC